MSETSALFLVLCVVLIVFFLQQLFWMHNFQKLVNKLMSRNFAEYEASKIKVEELTPNGMRVPIQDLSHIPEDLRVLQGIG